MTYRDPDSGWVFASYDAYERERRGDYEEQMTDEEECLARSGHAYQGDDNGVGRCWCGSQLYPAGGPYSATDDRPGRLPPAVPAVVPAEGQE